MIRKSVSLAKSAHVQDKNGRVTGKTYEPYKNISCDYIMPYSTNRATRDYGFTIDTTHRTFSFDDVVINDYLIDGEDVYHIVEAVKHNRSLVVLLERVKDVV